MHRLRAGIVYQSWLRTSVRHSPGSHQTRAEGQSASWLSRRAGNDAQDLARCGLLFKRLRQLAIAILQFFKQPDVFNCNDRLIGEGFEQLDLLVGERAHFRATNKNRPDGNALTQQRRG